MRTVVEKVLFLQDVDLFSDIATDQLVRIAAISKEVRAPAGTALFTEGTPVDALYLVLRGAIRLSRKGEEIDTAGEKKVLGVWALFEDETALVSAEVVRDAELLKISREDFFDLLSDHMEITQNIFRFLVRRVKELVQ